MLLTAARWCLSQAVQKYPLPIAFQLKQFENIRKKSMESNNQTIVSRSLVYICLRHHPQARSDMRMPYPEMPICRHCKSNCYVLVADTLGHLLRVYRTTYYFCVSCNKVHVWQGSGSELFTEVVLAAVARSGYKFEFPGEKIRGPVRRGGGAGQRQVPRAVQDIHAPTVF